MVCYLTKLVGNTHKYNYCEGIGTGYSQVIGIRYFLAGIYTLYILQLLVIMLSGRTINYLGLQALCNLPAREMKS